MLLFFQQFSSSSLAININNDRRDDSIDKGSLRQTIVPERKPKDYNLHCAERCNGIVETSVVSGKFSSK